MAFPLTGSSLSTAAIVVPSATVPVTQVAISSRTWAQSGGSLWTRPRSISQITVSVANVPVTAILVQRRWAGVGGAVSLPSFPQMPTPTTWPHAFQPES